MEPETYEYSVAVHYSNKEVEVIKFKSEHANWVLEVLTQHGYGMIKIPYQHIWVQTHDIERVQRLD
jgi:hypothetical protein